MSSFNSFKPVFVDDSERDDDNVTVMDNVTVLDPGIFARHIPAKRPPRHGRFWKTAAFGLSWKAALGVCAGLGLYLAMTRPEAPPGRPAIEHRSANANIARVLAEGRLVARPGKEVTLGSELGGTLVDVRVHEGDVVKAGEVVARLDTSEEKSLLAEARGKLSEALAELRYQESELKRFRSLQGATSESAFDHALRDARTARARVGAAGAAVQHSEARLAKLTIRAPFHGTVTNAFAQAGEALMPGAKLLTVVDLNSLRLEAEVDEYDVGRIAVGDAVNLMAEGYPGKTWHAVVEEMPGMVTTRRMKPADPGKPSDIRVLLLKARLSEPTPLKMGQRVEVEIIPSGSAK